MKRLTILSLMGLILVLAVAVAALRNADVYWASGMILATPMLFGVALIGALCGGERSGAPGWDSPFSVAATSPWHSWDCRGRTRTFCRPLSS